MVEHAYLVCYDICEQKRWRKVYKAMKGFGQWLQLSVFQCRLNKEKVLIMTDLLSDLIDQSEDHIMVIDLGPAETVSIKVESIGKRFDPIEKKAVIV
ncbi:MAG: CRISPR-associated endonuclease Cas2 [Desulfobacterales bacterium]|jgi:CRISPR-associated protein Cas2|nr:CRISPR-associated endonuclease Cas2 [Desulfobacterales bacterium]